MSNFLGQSIQEGPSLPAYPDFLPQVSLGWLVDFSRMTTVCLMLAAKYFEETEALLPSSEYAIELNIPQEDLLKMELQLASLLDWDLFIDRKEFDSYQCDLKQSYQPQI